jgi:hypothetical protein
MVSYPRQNSNFSFEIHFFKFDIQVSVLCITFSILHTIFCNLYATFSILYTTFFPFNFFYFIYKVLYFCIQLFPLNFFYFTYNFLYWQLFISNRNPIKTYCGLIVSTIDQSSNGASVSVPYFVFHITYYYSLLQKIDEEAVEYILEVIHSVTRKYMHAETLALLTKPLYFPNVFKVVVMVTR